MSKFIKPSYEQLERNFQSYCKHDGGRRITAESDHTRPDNALIVMVHCIVDVQRR